MMPPSSPLTVLRVSAMRLSAMIAVVGVLGCGRRETITQYTVDKAAAPQSPAGVNAPPVPGTSAGRAWFFKVTGPADTVAARSAEFGELVASLRIEDGRPVWTLPEGWREEAGEGMRLATLSFGDREQPLEVSVIGLPVVGSGGPGQDKYLRDNIDRWRGQLGLAPYSDEQWQALRQRASSDVAGEVRQMEGSTGPVTLVDLAGSTEDFPQARMLGAILMPPASSPRPPVAPGGASSPPSGGLSYDVPDGWTPGQTTAFSQAAFRVDDGEQQVEITVSTAGGDLLANVNRWRAQVMLPPITPEQLDAAARELTVEGRPASYFELVGERETILGAVLQRGSQQWFFKLRGGNDLARREKEHFEDFVQSVSFD